MKLTVSVLLGLVLVWSRLPAQTPVKPVSQPAAKSESAVSDHEKNIEAYIFLMRSDLRKEKSQVMSTVMQLDATDAAMFWPIYKDFETDLAKVYDGVVALLKQYATSYDNMTPAIADSLATKLLDLEQQRNDVKRKYYQQFKAALDPITAARFLQVENQIERVIDLQIAAELPVVGRSQP